MDGNNANQQTKDLYMTFKIRNPKGSMREKFWCGLTEDEFAISNFDEGIAILAAWFKNPDYVTPDEIEVRRRTSCASADEVRQAMDLKNSIRNETIGKLRGPRPSNHKYYCRVKKSHK